jgi:hypothetical protein
MKPNYKLENDILSIVLTGLCLLFILLLSSGCSLTKKGPDRAPNERYYRFSEKKGVLYHRRCKKLKKKKRDCVITEKHLEKDWDFFRYGDFIVIPFKYL